MNKEYMEQSEVSNLVMKHLNDIQPLKAIFSSSLTKASVCMKP